MKVKSIYFVTGNKGKFVEAKKKLSSVSLDVIQKDLGYPEIQAIKLEDVALYGAEHIQKKTSHPFILEDAGLFIDALNGFPGVYSAYVYHTIGCKGILKLMEKFKGDLRKSVFRSVFAFGASDETPRLFVGECNGTISFEERGEHGFGYDPIFIPEGETRTFAQMQTDEKNSFSHRSRSLDKLLDFFQKSLKENFKSI